MVSFSVVVTFGSVPFWSWFLFWFLFRTVMSTWLALRAVGLVVWLG